VGTPHPYGYAHQRERAKVQRQVTADGGFICWRCGEWFNADTPWDLGHDRDTGQWMGAECRPCNRGEGASYGNRMREKPNWTSQNW
jgi:hypothetical protein